MEGLGIGGEVLHVDCDDKGNHQFVELPNMERRRLSVKPQRGCPRSSGDENGPQRFLWVPL
jgi:hypothetical protein